ncbi:methionine adenosyltransferase [Botryobacter ruber]|uniref:methionine adenosyltransferase n=1 Tax=Botryobacter ruber TaxID=2171629 RepID=UPI000E0C19D9|nr:methionine adenosyltransferase [Botryobacter ruber]
MPYLFTSESVSEGHPDKVADQISDALLDEFLKQDPQSKVACETLVTTGLVVLSGEVKSESYVDVQKVTREVIKRIGYTKSEYKFDAEACGIISAIHEQSSDINQGVERKNPEEQGAGDQGMMFGYATNETDNYMPLALSISHLLLQELATIRKEGQEMTYLRPDAKSQVTIRYSDTHVPEKVETIVISTQHDEFVLPETDSPEARQQAEDKMVKQITDDITNVLIPRVLSKLPERTRRLFSNDIIYHINPTGKFVIGGPHGDTGLTGRKIIIDTYGGKGAHGGGAFSGKDSSKVDRSAAYAARHIAKNMVAAGVADQVLVQVAYAIGVAEPVGMYVTTYGSTKVKDASGNIMSDGEIAEKVHQLFDMRPYAIVKRFGLQNPIFSETAAYGHMGRTPGVKQVEIVRNGQKELKEFETFTWEKLDHVDKIKEVFGL